MGKGLYYTSSIYKFFCGTGDSNGQLLLMDKLFQTKEDKLLIYKTNICTFHTVDTVHLRHIKLSYRPTDAH
jgi:hypothetical protein